jgi:cytochrome c oxidase subunit 3/cytochrome c oxidase subunit I+III
MTSPVPQSGHATTSPEAAAVARQRRGVPTGVWGILIFLASETALFGTLIGTYFYLQFRSVHWPPPGIAAPSVALPIALTAALVLSMIPVWLAVRAAGAGRVRICWTLLFVALLVQAGYLAWQLSSYVSDLDKFSLTGSAYGSVYFTMLGADHAHVAVGLLLSIWMLARLVGGLTNHRVVAVRVVGWYWYFVAGITVVVTAAQVSPS